MPLIRRISDAMFCPIFPIPNFPIYRISIHISSSPVSWQLHPHNTWILFRSNGVVSEQIESFKVVNEFPHDPTAFTQGLLYGGNDTLLESTDLNGHDGIYFLIYARPQQVTTMRAFPFTDM
ncbi:hypothetical protein L2E82_11771 [Cichorium intybus]|uniref:Uncharacterized protein n=1 Tax=Cichorium intybus TaxID=13427 RepID=A0ACB9GE35_CICIN|nr:hypothetical protein L2E82_11771 [Cichorium intybus]